jgi:hypothetical protein
VDIRVSHGSTNVGEALLASDALKFIICVRTDRRILPLPSTV